MFLCIRIALFFKVFGLFYINGYLYFFAKFLIFYPMTGVCYVVTFENLVKKYNKKHEDTLPKVTPHILVAYILVSKQLVGYMDNFIVKINIFYR